MSVSKSLLPLSLSVLVSLNVSVSLSLSLPLSLPLSLYPSLSLSLSLSLPPSIFLCLFFLSHTHSPLVFLSCHCWRQDSIPYPSFVFPKAPSKASKNSKDFSPCKPSSLTRPRNSPEETPRKQTLQNEIAPKVLDSETKSAAHFSQIFIPLQKSSLGFSVQGVVSVCVMLLDVSQTSRTILTRSTRVCVGACVRIAVRIQQSNLLYELSPKHFPHISASFCKISSPFIGAVKTICGKFPQIFFKSSSNFRKILEVQFAVRGGGVDVVCS